MIETISPQTDTIEIKKRFIVLPYVSNKAENLVKRLKELVNNNFENLEFNVAFKAPSEIGQLFPFKDNIKKVAR